MLAQLIDLQELINDLNIPLLQVDSAQSLLKSFNFFESEFKSYWLYQSYPILLEKCVMENVIIKNCKDFLALSLYSYEAGNIAQE